MKRFHPKRLFVGDTIEKTNVMRGPPPPHRLSADDGVVWCGVCVVFIYKGKNSIKN